MKALKVGVLLIAGFFGFTKLQALANTAKHLFIDVNPVPNIKGFRNLQLLTAFKFTIKNFNKFAITVNDVYVEVMASAGGKTERIGLSSENIKALGMAPGTVMSSEINIAFGNWPTLASIITKADAKITFYTRYTFKGAQVEVPTVVDVGQLKKSLLSINKVSTNPLAGI